MKAKYYFFWDGFCSQWFKSNFNENGIKFSTAEQYMMYHKAITFGDFEIANKILKTRNPKIQKAFGRQVKNFNPDVWNSVARDIVYKGNYLKFSQNPELKEVLISIVQDELVEASPVDKIWGIGLAEDDPRALNKETWLGTNWLGEVLTKLKKDLTNG